MAGSRPLGLQNPSALDVAYLTQSEGSSEAGSAVHSAVHSAVSSTASSPLNSPLNSPFSSPPPSPRLNPIPSAGRALAVQTSRFMDLTLPSLLDRRDSERSFSSGVCSPWGSPRFADSVADLAQGEPMQSAWANSDAIQYDDSIPSPCPHLLSRVREGQRLGQGSFGQVFQADYIDDRMVGDNPQPDVPAVLKKLSTDKRGCPNQMRAFRDELTALHVLNGVSSPRLMDYDLNPQRPSYLMTKADGIALNKFDGLNPNTRPDPLAREQTAKKLTKAMLESLEAFHDRGFCHRDIKPDNVFVDTLSDGSYKIVFVDLGYATAVGKVMDTPFGNSKYTISCDDRPNAASIDLFSVGATLNALACEGEPDIFALQTFTGDDDTHKLPTDEMFAFVKYLCNGEHESISSALDHDWLRMD